MYIMYNKGLHKELLNEIRNRKLTHEQLMSIYQDVCQRKANKNKGMRNAMFAFLMCAIFILCLGMLQSSDSKMGILMLITFVIVFLIVFVYIKLNFVNKTKRQFMSALEEGYPEFMDEFNTLNECRELE